MAISSSRKVVFDEKSSNGTSDGGPEFELRWAGLLHGVNIFKDIVEMVRGMIARWMTPVMRMTRKNLSTVCVDYLHR